MFSIFVGDQQRLRHPGHPVRPHEHPGPGRHPWFNIAGTVDFIKTYRDHGPCILLALLTRMAKQKIYI